MESSSLSDPAVVKLAAEFVTARWPADLDNAIVSRYELVEIPALVFFTPEGSYIHQVPPLSRMNASQVAAAMREALIRAREASAKEQALSLAIADNPRDLAAHDALAQFQRKVFRYDDARVTEYRALTLANELGAPDADRRLSEQLYLDLKLRDFSSAARTIETFHAQFPTSPLAERVEYYRGLLVFHDSANLDEASRVWQEQLEAFPKGVWASSARTMRDKAQRMIGDRNRLGAAAPEVWAPRK